MQTFRNIFEWIFSMLVLVALILSISFFWTIVFDCKAKAAGLQQCVDALISTKEKAIIAVKPAGHQWGTREGAPNYRVERFCVDYPADPYKLASPWMAGETIVTDHRFESDGYGGVFDRKTGEYISPTEACER